MDLSQREGQYPVPPGAPQTLGVEFSGIIESEAEGAESGFKVGDEVFGLAYGGTEEFSFLASEPSQTHCKALLTKSIMSVPGAYAEYIAISTHMLIHKPRELSWETAAGIPETWITAIQAMYLIGEYAAGKSVLWHAGASSVSIAGIQLCAADHASQIFVTTSSQEKIDFCKSLGATDGFNYKTQDWSAEVLKATDGKGVDLIVDFIGPTYFKGNLNAAARDGRIVNLGFLGGTMLKEEIDLSVFLRKRLRFEGSSLRSRDEEYQGKLRDQLVEHALQRFREGTFKVPIERVFAWEEVRQAHELMETNRTMGKIICKVD